jgi:hypothetical protein
MRGGGDGGAPTAAAPASRGALGVEVEATEGARSALAFGCDFSIENGRNHGLLGRRQATSLAGHIQADEATTRPRGGYWCRQSRSIRVRLHLGNLRARSSARKLKSAGKGPSTMVAMPGAASGAAKRAQPAFAGMGAYHPNRVMRADADATHTWHQSRLL